MNPDAMAKEMIQRNHNRDGLPEIVAGATLLVAAGLIHAQTALPRHSAGFNIAFTVLIPILCLSGRPVLKWIRERYLIDRVGYVQHQPAPRKYKFISARVGLAAVLLLIVIEPLDSLLIAATGIRGGAVLAMCGRSPRFVVSAILMAAAGVAIGASGVALSEGFAMLFAIQGLLILLSGSVVFTRLLRQPS